MWISATAAAAAVSADDEEQSRAQQVVCLAMTKEKESIGKCLSAAAIDWTNIAAQHLVSSLYHKDHRHLDRFLVLLLLLLPLQSFWQSHSNNLNLTFPLNPAQEHYSSRAQQPVPAWYNLHHQQRESDGDDCLCFNCVVMTEDWENFDRQKQRHVRQTLRLFHAAEKANGRPLMNFKVSVKRWLFVCLCFISRSSLLSLYCLWTHSLLLARRVYTRNFLSTHWKH